MKFTSFSTYALLVAFSPNASSFVPSAARPPARSSTSPLSFSDVVHVTAAARPSSELNLFGSRWRKTRQINSQSKAGKAPITESEVRGLFELWNSALATGDSRIVASRYTKSPVLLPTVSDQPRMNYDSVKDYFDTFLLKKPQGKIIDGKINIGDGWASDTGIYEFTLGATGEKVKARYTYNYVMEDGMWKIQHHHSSVLPEEIAMGKPITEDEVRGLFNLWNNALATLDPKAVALRYAKKGVLLPTVSDTPRTNFSAIEDYFVNFLKLKPQGKILESYVTIGKNWCKDVGIYEFTMNATGKKVKGRYSFVYVYEDGEWKISHHHSSIMPEGIVTAQPITKDEVRGLFDLWNNALASRDPVKVANRYSRSAVLLPTVSDIPRTDFPGRVDYFTNFLKLEPQGKILDGEIVIGTNWAQDAGIYEFTMGATGQKVKGRYTFVYVYEDGEWKISQHHSSVMPEASKPQAITEEEVRNLFQLWNAALATEDPEAVANRYANRAVLLPTVSDVPRTDHDLIKDYFVSFLKKKPQGRILESNVSIGNNWCQDVGIYEFTMGSTGDKVKGRYSFVYVWEDGQWKISHHHSSVMPEAFLGPSPKPVVVTKDATTKKELVLA
ncbi:hypothetical protein HJC23_002216 [Cyclotella cryptica]|uniref:Calcium/calmodulin-dependent protein kinase II association-domain domain-containing protein n=1 Tax=Cyclotella cryptica TaxID=29204 RepID=A0ABD3P2E6_9STRA|eukprot:CCRYP_017858-RB/>CCRYP_017858-RB protein AED:0.06 eAED:0.06 QI:277/1/1/1/1/1/5/191/612